MSEIKRYAHKSYIDTETMEQCLQCEFVEHSVGGFVKYEDHKAKVDQLESQNAKLVELVDTAITNLAQANLDVISIGIEKELNEILNDKGKEQG